MQWSECAVADGRWWRGRHGRRLDDGHLEVLRQRSILEGQHCCSVPGRRRRTHGLPAVAVDALEEVLPLALRLELIVLLVQLQRSPCILNRVVSVGLDGRLEHGPREEAERQLALPVRLVVNVDRVDDLLWRDVDV